MIDARLLAKRIVVLIEHARIDVSTEATAHRGILEVLDAEGLEPKAEVRFGSRDRIDIMAGPVGIEIKIHGHQQRRSIYRQMERYAEHDAIGALVLATGAPWPGAMGEVGGKPLFTASLSRGWL